MNNEDAFTIYLPSNSPGAEAQSMSEDQYNQVSSWYKTTLDGNIDLDGDGWEVGLAEICFPSKLLSLIEGFDLGVAIMNPPKVFLKSVREEKLQKIKTDKTRKVADDVTIFQVMPELDHNLIYYKTEMVSTRPKKYKKGPRGPIRPRLRPRQPDKTTTPTKKSERDVITTEPQQGKDTQVSTVAAMHWTQQLPPLAQQQVPPTVPSESKSTTDDSDEYATAPDDDEDGEKDEEGDEDEDEDEEEEDDEEHTVSNEGKPAQNMTAESIIPADFKIENRSTIRPDTENLSSRQVLNRIGMRLPSSDKAINETPGHVNIKDFMNEVLKTKGKGIELPASKTPQITPVTGDGMIERKWFTPRYYQIAYSEILPIENTVYPELAQVPAGFYSSRGELVSLMNERLTYFMNNRTYPSRDWSLVLIEPYFYGRDSGLVTVSAGFFDPLNSAYSNHIYLTPTVSSLRALKFLGLDLKKWIWNTTLKTYVYTVPADTLYSRRDDINLTRMPIAPTEDLFMLPRFGTKLALLTQQETLDLDINQYLMQFQLLERPYVTNFAKVRHNLLRPKTQPPQFLFVYVDVARPVAVGNTRAPVLRITTLKSREEHIQSNETAAAGSSLGSFINFNQNEPERFMHILYVPVSRKSFNNITVFLSDENGSQLSFDSGTVYVVLQFRRRVPIASLLSLLSA